MIFSFIDRTPGTSEAPAKFDRFGGYIDKNGDFQDKGTFVADYGSDFDERALPDKTKLSPINGYEFVKPIPMIEGSAIP